MNKGQYVPIILVLICSLFVSTSCNSIMGKLYGIQKVDSFNEQLIESVVAKDSLLFKGDQYYLDSDFVDYVYEHFPDSPQMAHDLVQPMQAMYYDKGGSLISWHLNCYAGGFPNLKWNRGKVFDVFPPKSQRPITAQVSLKKIAPYFKSLQTQKDKSRLKGAPYKLIAYPVVLVFWNYTTFKQSRRLIEQVEDNLKLDASGERPNLVFVNTDLMYKENLTGGSEACGRL